MREIEQPPDVSFALEDGVFVKQMFLAEAGTVVPQHSHAYAHTSMLAVGSVRVWCDDELLGDFKAPRPIAINAGCKHTFLTLEPGTLLYCIHNVSRTGEVEVLAHHEIGDLQCHGAM